MKNILPLPGMAHCAIAILHPKTFDETARAVEALKAGTIILLNLADLASDKAQRFLDFAAGSACAISAHHQAIGRDVFLFAPPTTEIMTKV
jgi:cell division inhibitor SepF